jgi:hypothetical protein
VSSIFDGTWITSRRITNVNRLKENASKRFVRELFSQKRKKEKKEERERKEKRNF